MRIVRTSEVVFVDDNVEKDFFNLKDDEEIKKHILRAIEDIKQNAFCGIPIPKKLIPKEYIKKFRVVNLWKYDLPGGWRLLYFVTTPNRVEIVSIILEWFNHKDYDRKFKYG